MELFDKKFVHFMWDDELKGKKCFLSNYIGNLRSYVEKGDERYFEVEKSYDVDEPFQAKDGINFTFAYYDPNYEVKKAFLEGKVIQVHCANGTWTDCNEPKWYDDCMYRVKPEDEKWIAYLARETNGSCYLSACAESYWKAVQKKFGAKTKLFIGTDAECVEWYTARQKFVPTIEAWEDGKTIQFLSRQQQSNGVWIDVWYDCSEKPLWHLNTEYRAKPEEKIAYIHKGVDGYIIDGFIDGSVFQGTKEECTQWIASHTMKRMTYRQLAEWTNKQNGEIKSPADPGYVFCDFSYREDLENEKLPESYKIRHWGSDEWIEPTVEVYMEDCK